MFDVFQVGSIGGTHQLHREDQPRVEKLLKKVISGQVDVDEYLKSHSKPRMGDDGPRLSFPSRIRIDNDVSPTATVIEVQAGDRLGLGYRIARTLASFNLNIIFAKLATEKSHAFDVFYVRDASGGKVTDPGRLHEIEERLRDGRHGTGLSLAAWSVVRLARQRNRSVLPSASVHRSLCNQPQIAVRRRG